MQDTIKSPVPVRPGTQVTFVDLPKPVIFVVTIDWIANSAVYRYHDELAGKSVHLEWTADRQAPASQQTGKK